MLEVPLGILMFNLVLAVRTLAPQPFDMARPRAFLPFRRCVFVGFDLCPSMNWPCGSSSARRGSPPSPACVASKTECSGLRTISLSRFYFIPCAVKGTGSVCV